MLLEDSRAFCRIKMQLKTIAKTNKKMEQKPYKKGKNGKNTNKEEER